MQKKEKEKIREKDESGEETQERVAERTKEKEAGRERRKDRKSGAFPQFLQFKHCLKDLFRFILAEFSSQVAASR